MSPSSPGIDGTDGTVKVTAAAERAGDGAGHVHADGRRHEPIEADLAVQERRGRGDADRARRRGFWSDKDPYLYDLTVATGQ